MRPERTTRLAVRLVLSVLSVTALVLAFTDVSERLFYFVGGMSLATVGWAWFCGWLRLAEEEDDTQERGGESQ